MALRRADSLEVAFEEARRLGLGERTHADADPEALRERGVLRLAEPLTQAAGEVVRRGPG